MDTLWNQFSRTVEAYADRPAILHGDAVLDFGTWHRRSASHAFELQRRGLKPGDRVLLWTQPSPDMAVALMGVWAAGGIVTFMDPSEPESHLRHALECVAPSLVIADPHSLPAGMPNDTPIAILSDLPIEGGKSPASVRCLPTDPASIVFTSGSTGKPKGVTQSHGNLVRACRAVGGYLGLHADDRILCPIPWAFDYGYGQLLSTVLLGATHVLPEALDPFGICAAIATHQPTVLPGIPSLFTYLLRGVSPFRDTDVTSVRLITNTGGAIPGPILEEMFEAFPNTEIVLNYGLTETYRTAYLDPSLTRERSESIGSGIPGVEAIVVREDDTPAAAGEIGEIVHRGDYICLGYWNDPEATARAIRADPLAPPGCPNPPRALYSGDLGLIDADGFLQFKGRRDHQLKSMGVRVSVGEIEELIHQSGLVREVAVVGVKNMMIGEEIRAAIVPGEGVVDVVDKLRQYARKVMSTYMLPRKYFVLDALPKTRTGKPDYPALRTLAERPQEGIFASAAPAQNKKI